MELFDAINLIKPAFSKAASSQWADLGCGSGVFTYALASLLGKESVIYAIDQHKQKIDSVFSETKIEFQIQNFENLKLPLNSLDGILMANSLHYVKSQLDFVKKLKTFLKSEGKILLIEYNTNQSNPWVPYPLPFSLAEELFKTAGFTEIQKIGERSSIYRADKMYSCLIS